MNDKTNSLSFTNNFATVKPERSGKPQPREEMTDFDFEVPVLHTKEFGPFQLASKVDILL